MKDGTLQLTPYLHFNGNCEEALNRYAQLLNGRVENLGRYKDAPFPVEEGHKNRVLHSEFYFDDNKFMACDIFPGMQAANSSNVILTLGLTNEERAHALFGQLAEGGKITMPLEKQFWGALFGQVTDRFGIQWMVNCEESK